MDPSQVPQQFLGHSLKAPSNHRAACGAPDAPDLLKDQAASVKLHRKKHGGAVLSSTTTPAKLDMHLGGQRHVIIEMPPAPKYTFLGHAHKMSIHVDDTVLSLCASCLALR
eukprot:CAMPEP_0178453986 /NCGR_PEP_ID=MMETSP0689_2-20121128/45106_1 /TAXON_ID=160604 /ORGANISM="Amphidinium massartii, Strain CS-259" /LENGTH=110 /DNA_ID=CAMNT_0020079867 /DNA_START=1062 /DNA_END=1395 /DNA_ORIENTATION=+